MQSRLDEIEKRYIDLEAELSNPEVLTDQEKLKNVAKAHANLEEIVTKYRQYKGIESDIEEAEEMQKAGPDEELAEFLDSELERLRTDEARLEDELKILLLPKDPNDDKDVIVEIRGGTGGDEAALFAADLMRMYMRYAEQNGWQTEIMSSSPTDLGGFKEVIFSVQGRGAYSRLKYESGVHRVQRIPDTEASGRIHTSTATVAVLPEAEEVELEIKPDDLRVDVFRSTGHGGQSVNTTDSAVRITHIPTGMVVTCQDEKSQLKNREKALRVLRARLLDELESEQKAELDEARRVQVGSGERSERIRTYNYPQNRLTDHRINLTLYRLGEILEGNIDEVIDALMAVEQSERLKKIG
ncbi:MAG TPA: peptide chain release factor 1 [Firmicutes bacterium]|jgi:peptide chain release factor 1|nr:peptide chain release factor 1 [Bacillota bacterium]